MDGVDLQVFTGRRFGEGQTQFRADLPRPSPLPMAAQSLADTPLSETRPATSPAGMGLRRAAVLGATLIATAIAAFIAAQALMIDGFGPLDPAIWAISALLFAWTAFSFFIVLAGAAAGAKGRGLGIDLAAPPPRLIVRTAILAPVFNEESHLVFARLQAIYESLQSTGQGAHFDLFILSDSTHPEVQATERAAFNTLRLRCQGESRIFYRLRLDNHERKAGNIADWVRRFGGAYGHMVVLDADSLMTGDTLVRLAGAMEANPGVGLLQTVPLLVNRGNLFGRAQQFAGRLYGPLLSRGLAWWSGAEGNYWGHNAIIRVEAFAAYAGLPHLPGRKPFGGAIMSHDFVEAALIRRAGYAVHMAPELGGSFEECPPSLAALMKRDSRWCQGNLQHLKVLPGSGLHWVSRMHLFNGAMAYGVAPLWFALLCMGVAAPLWPALSRGPGAAGLASQTTGLSAVGCVFAVTMLFVLAPKLMAYAAAMSDRALRRAFGGAGRAFQGLLLETAISALVAPIVMLGQARSIVGIILGRDWGWNAQQRGEDRLAMADAARCHRSHTVAGLILGAGALAASPIVFLWVLPALAGLMSSIPLAAALARTDLGQAAKRCGLLLTPEETHAPEVLSRANRLTSDYLFQDRPHPVRDRLAYRSHSLGLPSMGQEVCARVTQSWEGR